MLGVHTWMWQQKVTRWKVEDSVLSFLQKWNLGCLHPVPVCLAVAAAFLAWLAEAKAPCCDAGWAPGESGSVSNKQKTMRGTGTAASTTWLHSCFQFWNIIPQSITITIHHYHNPSLSLFITIHHYPSLFITIHHYPQLSNTILPVSCWHRSKIHLHFSRASLGAVHN